MANLTQVLEGLTTKEAKVSTADLANELKASTEGTRKQLSRLKDKGYVEGDSQEGWLITEAGRRELERGGVHPSMIDEGVTPREKFEAISRRIGITEDRIVLAADIVWSGDYTDIKWVWEALGQADIRDDLRKIWCNSWRAFLQKGIPPELEVELTSIPKEATAEAGKEGVSRAKPGRDYIIIDDEPVRVGENLGDYSLQDAKDILAIRVLRSRFGAAQAGAGQTGAGSQLGTAEKVSELLTALGPYINKGSDLDTLKEILADKLALQRQEILSRMPQSGQPSQPKSAIEQITEFVGSLSSLKDAGPMIRAILGIPEPSGNPNSPGFPVQIEGPDGKPLVMDLGQVIDWRKFQNEERRADGRHDALVGLVQTVRENLPDGVAALKAAATEIKGGTGAKATETKQEQTFSCGDCGTQFSAPPGWAGQPLKCPNPSCGREYTREELLG